MDIRYSDFFRLTKEMADLPLNFDSASEVWLSYLHVDVKPSRRRLRSKDYRSPKARMGR
jgi:hypothetical protein